MRNTNPLWYDILKFSRNKSKFALGLIILGLLGLILPILPGILLLVLGIYLLKPEWYNFFGRWIEKIN